MPTPTVPIAVAGATGRLGGRIATRLAAAGLRQRLLVRDAARAPALPGTDIAVTTYADLAASTQVLRGVQTLFMVSGAEAIDRVDQHRTFIDAAVAAGVTRVVYTSFVGAAPDATFTLVRDHWATEEHLRRSGLQTVVLRDSLYLDVLSDFVGADGVLRGPAGDGRVAGVATDDIADAAVQVLTDPAAHDGHTYELTGPAALSLDEIAAILSAHRGTPVTYVEETVEQAYASRAGFAAPQWQLDAWVSTYSAIAAGEMALVTGDVELLTGHPATSLIELLQRP